MTRAEKKEELIGLFSTGAIYLGDLIDECFEFADARPNWISVEDELPKEDDDYFDLSIYVLATDGKTIKLCYYDYDKECWFDEDLWTINNITHWMPKPAPPSGSSSEKPNNCQQGEEIKGNLGKISPNKKGGKQ